MTKPDTSFAVFRKEDAVDFEASGAMTPPEPGTFDVEAAQRLRDAAVDKGAANELLFAAGGMSLARVWFKSHYPLPRHSHDCDCLYLITAGSLRLGTEELGPGDGFYIGANVPYTYVAGDSGVELLEFRAATEFGIKLMGANAAWGKKALQIVQDRRDAWLNEKRPSETEASRR